MAEKALEMLEQDKQRANSLLRTIDPESRAIVAAIITLAGSLGFQTIAEGVETIEQLEFLRLKGCGEAQGYYFSKPLNVSEFEAFMLGRR